jgi:aspartate/methionine/tyrosine aminotransferase
VSAQGGFFSYVRHPYVQDGRAVPSEMVSEVLAKRCGVVTLPGSFFMPERGSPEWRALEEQASPLVEDRWIR